MEDREMPGMRKYGESNTTRIMMATVPHVISGSGFRKFQADGFCSTEWTMGKKYWTVLTNWDTTLPGKDEIYLTENLRYDGFAELILNPLNENPTRPSLSG